MITVRIDEGDFLQMLLDRLEYWTSDNEVIELYKNYYQSLIDSGCYENCELNVMDIVDNDYINYTMVCDIEELESEFNISPDDIEYSDRILEVNDDNTLFLVQTY